MSKKFWFNSFAASAWHGMKARSLNGGSKDLRAARYYHSKGILLLMSQNEFNLWVALNWHLAVNMLRPSIDRINPKGNYSLDNIRILETSENVKLGRDGRKRAVVGQCLKTGKKVFFDFINQAHKAGFARGNIIPCLKGRKHTAYGMNWSYL